MGERILVIDDEPDMLMLMSMIIEENTNWVVETTNNPSEGLKMVMENDYNLVITDLKMPGLDGMEVFEELNEMKPHIPVIIITAYGSLEIAHEARNKGVADFITKPFRKDKILFTMDRVLEIARLKKENLELKNKLEEKSRLSKED
jgi:DNA-binding NtrC family response regulator